MRRRRMYNSTQEFIQIANGIGTKKKKTALVVVSVACHQISKREVLRFRIRIVMLTPVPAWNCVIRRANLRYCSTTQNKDSKVQENDQAEQASNLSSEWSCIKNRALYTVDLVGHRSLVRKKPHVCDGGQLTKDGRYRFERGR